MRILARFLWLIPAAYLLMLMGIGAFMRPQADDLGWFYVVDHLGITGSLSRLWHNNGGRFFSNLLFALAARSAWPISHPALLPAITLMSQAAATLLLQWQLCIRLNGHRPPWHNLLFYSLSLTLAQLVILPDLCSAVYWYTGAALYQWAYIALLLLAAAALRVSLHRGTGAVAAMMILLMVTGFTNELSAIIIQLSVIVITIGLYRQGLVSKTLMFAICVVAASSLVLNLSAPGLRLRKDMLTQGKSAWAPLATWVAWMGSAAWYILRNPLGWVLMAEAMALPRITLRRQQWLTLAAILSLALLAILMGTGGSLAPRTLNAFVALAFILLLAGLASQPVWRWEGFGRWRKPVLVLAIIGSSLTADLLQSAVAGYFFSRAYDIQWQTISHTRNVSVTVQPLAVIRDSLVRTKPLRFSMQKWALENPRFLWFGDPGNEAATMLNMARRSGVDTICLGTEKIINDHYRFPE